MTPMIFNLGPTELIIILVIVLVLFGGTRLAGLGKSSGRAIREFKEETRAINEEQRAKGKGTGATSVDDAATHTSATSDSSAGLKDEVADAEIVEPRDPHRNV